jgi:hypothetical protein
LNGNRYQGVATRGALDQQICEVKEVVEEPGERVVLERTILNAIRELLDLVGAHQDDLRYGEISRRKLAGSLFLDTTACVLHTAHLHEDALHQRTGGFRSTKAVDESLHGKQCWLMSSEGEGKETDWCHR